MALNLPAAAFFASSNHGGHRPTLQHSLTTAMRASRPLLNAADVPMRKVAAWLIYGVDDEPRALSFW